MAKNQGPWGSSDDVNPWGSAEETVSKPKVVNFEKIIDRKGGNGGFEFKIKWAVLILLLVWLASGFYQVQPSEQGVVLRFGAYNRTTDAGLHYHLPYPIESVDKVSITQERSITLGVTEAYDASNLAGLRNSRNGSDSELNSFTESHMLTGDENIVDINLTVVWKIKNAKDYLFNMRSPDVTVRVAAQSVLREIVGQSEMQPIITGDRGKVEDETKAELQKVLEVQRAKADMERFKNEAEAYRNEVLPKARGEAAKRLQEAQAYREAVVNKAKGDAERFISVYNAYKQGKEITAKRLYLETMEGVLANSRKVILDPSAKGGNILPILPLNRNNQTQESK